MGILSEIRKDAKSSFTKIQSGEEKDLEELFNKMFYADKNPAKEAEFIVQVMTRGTGDTDRKGLHASGLIVSENKWCLRQQVLSLLYKQLQGEHIEPGLKRIFEEGNAIHEKWQRLFIRAGYSGVTDLDYTRYNSRLRIGFTPDIICNIPEFFTGFMVGEIKSVNTMQFRREGFKHPSAGKQLQWYMRLLIEDAKLSGNWDGVSYTKGFVLNEDKNTQEFKLEVYDYNSAVTDFAISRCEDIRKAYRRFIKENIMVDKPKDATGLDCKKCKNCPMREACYNIGKGRVKL